MSDLKKKDSDDGKFGTFGGVFTPSTLTILGVIMFLRFGQVVGQSGVFYAVLIVIASKAITTLTAFSLSATATNTRVKGGGAYFLISRREIRARWGDLKSGLAFERARKALLRLEEEQFHPKNWRPAILALSGGAWNRIHLAEYGYWLTTGHGVLTLAHVLTGDVDNRHAARRSEEARLRKFIAKEELAAFPAVVVDADLFDGIKSLLQCHGIGGMRSNTVLVGWSENPERFEDFGRMLRLIRHMNRSIIAIKCDEEKERWATPVGSIDVWWETRQHGSLMLLLCYLLLQNREWRLREIRLLYPIASEADRPGAEKQIEEIQATARIPMKPEIVVTGNVAEAIQKQSADAGLVFIEFNLPIEGHEEAFVKGVGQFTRGFMNVILGSDAGDVSLEA